MFRRADSRLFPDAKRRPNRESANSWMDPEKSMSKYLQTLGGKVNLGLAGGHGGYVLEVIPIVRCAGFRDAAEGNVRGRLQCGVGVRPWPPTAAPRVGWPARSSRRRGTPPAGASRARGSRTPPRARPGWIIKFKNFKDPVSAGRPWSFGLVPLTKSKTTAPVLGERRRRLLRKMNGASSSSDDAGKGDESSSDKNDRESGGSRRAAVSPMTAGRS